jgi:hypothetical protein
MAAIIVELGHEHTIRRPLSLSRSVKDRIVQNFPEKIAVAVPGFGAQEFALRAYVKSFLEGVPAPTLKATVAVIGTAANVDAASIEVIDLRVIGTNAGSFSAADAKVSYAFDADVEPAAYAVTDCAGPQGVAGRQRSRAFKFIWEIAIEIAPGVSGVYEIDEFEVTVATPCCVPPPPVAAESEEDEGEGAEVDEAGDDEDGEEDGAAKPEKPHKKSKKKGRKRR